MESSDVLRRLLEAPSAKTWGESVKRAKEIEEAIKQIGKAVDQRKCAVKRGVIETEVDMVKGIVRI